METFGDKIRQAVESLELPLEEVAEAMGIDVEHLRALGRDELGAVPDDASTHEGLRALALLIGVDPEEVVADFERERQESTAGSPEAEPSPAAPSEDHHPVPSAVTDPAAEPKDPVPRPGRGRAIGVAGMAFAVLAVSLLGFSVKRLTSKPREIGPARPDAPLEDVLEEETPLDPAAIPRHEAVDEALLPEADPPAVQDTDSPRPATGDEDRPFPRDQDASEMSIPEYGIGSRVVNHALVREARRFPEGGQVWFWTRVEGGAPGKTLYHVWIHEGEEVLRLPLTIGAKRWRTYTSKTLHPGSVGGWAVEARDASGRVLARREFSCYARP